MPYVFFFFNDTATTEIYTLSLHDALPIYVDARPCYRAADVRDEVVVVVVDDAGGTDHRRLGRAVEVDDTGAVAADRKSTRLNSSHANISYAVFCLKKKKNSNYTSILH